ncbi:hypothetical protein WMF26_05170 [Sorangium sp. So ce185]|uniref:hypothetical protein n=1 Tax=Sorangium sp. So ce185 TaxID=3133287 RepID=UPI003F5DCA8B
MLAAQRSRGRAAIAYLASRACSVLALCSRRAARGDPRFDACAPRDLRGKLGQCAKVTRRSERGGTAGTAGTQRWHRARALRRRAAWQDLQARVNVTDEELRCSVGAKSCMNVVAGTSSAHHHGDLRQALIDAALRALAHQRAEHLSLRALGRELGVSPRALARQEAVA